MEYEVNVSLGAREPAKLCGPVTAYAKHNRAVIGTNCSGLSTKFEEYAANQFSLRDTRQGVYVKGNALTIAGNVLVVTFYPMVGLTDPD